MASHRPDRRRGPGARWSRALVALGLVAGLAGAADLTPAGASRATGGVPVLNVVAGENFWGSLAAQLGGRQVHVTSIVSDPNADPHEYESSPTDARLMAGANYVILNGAGYDAWANRLLAAQPEAHRRVLTVATLLGKTPGDNPHFWYDPAYVFAVMRRITADYTAMEPGRAAYFSARAAAVQRAFAPYRARLA